MHFLLPFPQKRQYLLMTDLLLGTTWFEIKWCNLTGPTTFQGLPLSLKIQKLFHCFIILLHVIASQFLVRCCCICLCQNWSCDVTAAFTGAKNLWYASSHSVIKAFCFVWPMIPPATFLDHFTRVSCQVQQHWRIQCWEATPYFSGIIEHNLKYGLRSSHQRRMLCFLFIPLLYSTILKQTIIDV